jgi:hypothetical protein
LKPGKRGSRGHFAPTLLGQLRLTGGGTRGGFVFLHFFRRAVRHPPMIAQAESVARNLRKSFLDVNENESAPGWSFE